MGRTGKRITGGVDRARRGELLKGLPQLLGQVKKSNAVASAVFQASLASCSSAGSPAVGCTPSSVCGSMFCLALRRASAMLSQHMGAIHGDKPVPSAHGSAARARTGLRTLVFTDIAGSTSLKQALGDREAVGRIQHHHALVRELLAGFPDAEETSTVSRLLSL